MSPWALALVAASGLSAARAATLRQPFAAPPAPAAPGAPAGLSETSSKRIGAVVDTLKDLLTSIENEEASETKNFKCAMDWCQSETASKKTEVEEAEVSLEDRKVAVRQHSAKISELQYVLDKNDQDIEELNDAMAQAESIREEEQKKYEEDKSLNLQSTTQITQAIEIVQKVHTAGGFLQNGVVQRMQLNEPGESSFVLGVMKSLKTNLVRNQNKADKNEAKAQSMYDKMITTKKEQLAATAEESRTKKILLSESNTKLTQTKDDIVSITEQLKEAKEYLEDTQASCADKAKEWQVRTEDRVKEKAAIREAVSFLEITYKEKEQQEMALLQRRQPQHTDSAESDDEDDDAEDTDNSLPSLLQVSSSGMGIATALIGEADGELATLAANRANSGDRQDVFDKVKIVVANLIETLKQQQQEETEKKDWCKSEIAKKTDEKADTEDMLRSLNATIDRKTGEVTTLTQEVSDINAAIADSKSRDQSLAKVRTEEKAVYESGTRDRKLALKVLKEATQVLRRFYETQDKTGLVQAAAKKQMPETFSGSSRKSGESNVVIAMLEKIAEDIEREQHEAEVEENAARSEYETQVKDARKEFDDRMEEVTMRVTRKAKVLVQLDNHKESQEQGLDKSEAITGQLAGLSADCDQLLANHDAREKARAFEIAQLRDVIDILSGSQIAARTGLMQAQAGAAVDREFQDMSRAINGLESQARGLAVR